MVGTAVGGPTPMPWLTRKEDRPTPIVRVLGDELQVLLQRQEGEVLA